MERLLSKLTVVLLVCVTFSAALTLPFEKENTTTQEYWKQNTDVLEDEDDLRFIDGRDGESYRAEVKTPADTSPQKDVLYLKPDEEETLDDLDNGGNVQSKRTFESGENYLWPDAIVPYEFSTEKPFSRQSSINKIQDAIKTYHESTCVRWKPFSSKLAEKLGHQDRVVFINGDGCSSYAGRMRWGGQPLSLSEYGCIYADTIQHEMGHALGMLHEQNRGDRDKNVIVHYDNISGGKNNGQYSKLNTDDYAPYNLHSSLQYAPWFFSSNGKATMTTPDKDLQFLMISGVLTFYDVMAINKAYKCADHCDPMPLCQNGGFANKECRCTCPSGLSGNRCQSIETKCGGIIDLNRGEEHTLTSPNYPKKYQRGIECVWLVRAPNDYRILIDAQDFDLTDKPNKGCYHWLEVRYNLVGQLGPSYCGNSFGDGTKITTLLGEQNILMLKFNSKRYRKQKAGRGFKLKLISVYAGCDSSPCQNGGVCRENVDNTAFKCSCSKGFGGSKCEQVSAADVSCDFENYPDDCFLTNIEEDNFDWFAKTGRTPSGGTGPDSAHSGKQYMFIEASKPHRRNEKARLVSTPKFKAIPRCLSFFYHMHGLGIGSLRVYIKGSGLPEKEVWSQIGRKGNKWIAAQIKIPRTKSLIIIIEGERGKSWSGDIAIDSFKLSPGTCDGSSKLRAPISALSKNTNQAAVAPAYTITHASNATASPMTTSTWRPTTRSTTPITTTQPPTETTTTTIPTTTSGNSSRFHKTAQFECNFELSDCAIEDWFWDIQWVFGYAAESSSGNTFYTISSTRDSDNKIGVFSLPFIMLVNRDYCLSFDFRRTEKENNCPHMKIATINSLAVEKSVWAHSDCNVITWTRYEIDISSASNSSSIAFVVQVMKNGFSNIQIDNIMLIPDE